MSGSLYLARVQSSRPTNLEIKRYLNVLTLPFWIAWKCGVSCYREIWRNMDDLLLSVCRLVFFSVNDSFSFTLKLPYRLPCHIACSFQLPTCWYTTPHSTPTTLLATLTSSLMNTSPFLAIFHLFINPPCIFVMSLYLPLTWISQQPVDYQCHIHRSLKTWVLHSLYYNLPNSQIIRPKLTNSELCHALLLKCLHIAILHPLPLAPNNLTHRIQAPGTYLLVQSPYYNGTTQPSYLRNLISVQPSCSTRSSRLFTLCHPLTCYVVLVTNDWSFISDCFTLSLKPAPCFSPLTSSQSLCLWLSSSYTSHIILLCWFATLVIRNSLTFPFPA